MLDGISPFFCLKPDSSARDRAVMVASLPKGSVILSTPPIAAVLVDSEKGRRCDSCLRPRTELHRCTGCRRYWYCDSTCQMVAWKAHHRRLCKPLQTSTTSSAYEELSSEAKLHILLLAHLLAEHGQALLSMFPSISSSPVDFSNPLSVLLSLLPQHTYKHVILPVPLHDRAIPDSLVTFLSSRFANNNFTMHTARMDVFAHGVFPLASRSFNHSCRPSMVPVYSTMKDSRAMRMEMKLIRDVRPGEELTIPYTDPAIDGSTRRHDLELTYDFTCMCSLCQITSSESHPSSPTELAHFESRLRQHVLPILHHSDSSACDFLEEFLPVLHPSYLPSLSKLFSDASHDGPYDIAVQKGETLLAVYSLIYPPSYPMIGLQSLELAKTCWNAFVTDPQKELKYSNQDELRCPLCGARFDCEHNLQSHMSTRTCQKPDDSAQPIKGSCSRSCAEHDHTGILQRMSRYLQVAERTFSVLFGDAGETADEEEPISELKLLKQMLKAEEGQ